MILSEYIMLAYILGFPAAYHDSALRQLPEKNRNVPKSAAIAAFGDRENTEEKHKAVCN
jgi:hypothetical protein